MFWRRVSLLVLGIASGIFCAVVLYFVSVKGSLIYITKPRIENVVSSEAECGLTEVRNINSFPCSISGTTLVAERLAVYEGPFLEDYSDREVVNIASLVVKNTGNLEITKCYIEVYLESECLTFYSEHIPPSSSVLLLESSEKKYTSDSIIFCSGWQMIDQVGTDVSAMLHVEDRAMGTIIVTNISDMELYNIHIYYKSWLSPPDIYVGGVSYCSEISSLLPGETTYIYPNHYAYGFSKIVSIISK